MTNRAGGSVPVYTEDLDLYRFNAPGYPETLATYLQEKYRDKPIGVVISVGSSALDYALRLRTSVWPNVPIVFAAVDKKTADIEHRAGCDGHYGSIDSCRYDKGGSIVAPGHSPASRLWAIN